MAILLLESAAVLEIPIWTLVEVVKLEGTLQLYVPPDAETEEAPGIAVQVEPPLVVYCRATLVIPPELHVILVLVPASIRWPEVGAVTATFWTVNALAETALERLLEASDTLIL